MHALAASKLQCCCIFKLRCTLCKSPQCCGSVVAAFSDHSQVLIRWPWIGLAVSTADIFYFRAVAEIAWGSNIDIYDVCHYYHAVPYICCFLGWFFCVARLLQGCVSIIVKIQNIITAQYMTHRSGSVIGSPFVPGAWRMVHLFCCIAAVALTGCPQNAFSCYTTWVLWCRICT